MSESRLIEVSSAERGNGCYNERGWGHVREMLFPDELDRHFPWFGLRPNNLQYDYIAAGTKFNPANPARIERIRSLDVKFGFQTFFAPGVVVGDIGCGKGIATTEIARKFPKITVYGIDIAFGSGIAQPPNGRNLIFVQDDWEVFQNIPDGTFDRILGVESFATHYWDLSRTLEALQRVTKPGAVLRATYSKVGARSSDFGEWLAEAGWDVYYPSERQRVVIATRPD